MYTDNNLSVFIKNMRVFKQAYLDLLTSWPEDLNDAQCNAFYPFNKSFDELTIINWVNEVVAYYKTRIPVSEPVLSEKSCSDLLRVLKVCYDDIDCLTVEEIEHITRELKCSLYAMRVKAFHKHVIDSFPDLPNDTPENQARFDEAWDKFYEMPWTITFNGKSVTIENDATIYNGIEGTLSEIVNYCL